MSRGDKFWACEVQQGGYIWWVEDIFLSVVAV